MNRLQIEIDDACKDTPLAENQTDQLWWCPHQKVLLMRAKGTGKSLALDQVSDAELNGYLEGFYAHTDAALAAMNRPPIH